jgi:hypothetical protein
MRSKERFNRAFQFSKYYVEDIGVTLLDFCTSCKVYLPYVGLRKPMFVVVQVSVLF